MAINFPDNPNANDVFTDGGKSWIWDGTTWKIYSSTTSGIGLGDLSVNTSSVGTAALSYNNTTGVFTYTPPDLSAVQSDWNATTGLKQILNKPTIPPAYTLPTASTTVLGGVKVDGSTINIANGVISGANTYSLPTASTTVLGGVKIDGTTITINNGVITASSSSTTTNLKLTDESGDTECFPVFCGAATNDQTPHTNLSFKFNATSGELQAGSFKKIGGSSSEFLKADGSIDSNTYQPSGSYLSTTGVQNIQGQLIVDKINLNDNIIQSNTASDELVIRGKGVGGAAHLKLDDDVTIVGDLTVQGTFVGGVPIGTIVAYGGSTAPSGWQICNGATPVTTALQVLLGGTVPDLRNRFIVGAGSTYSAGDKGGSTSETVNISGSDTVNISASDNVTISGTTGAPVSSNLFGLGDVGGSNKHVHSFSGSATVNISASDTVNISGSDTVNTLPPYYALIYIIKY